MKIRNESLDLDAYAVIRRRPEAETWTILGEPDSNIAAVEFTLGAEFNRLFQDSIVWLGEAQDAQTALEEDDSVDSITIGGWEYSIVRLATVKEERLGTDFAREHPENAAGLVYTCHKTGGDVLNAWNVLVSAVGRDEAWRQLSSAIQRKTNLTAPHALAFAHRILDEASAEERAH